MDLIHSIGRLSSRVSSRTAYGGTYAVTEYFLQALLAAVVAEDVLLALLNIELQLAMKR